jgi:hypothetical protein
MRKKIRLHDIHAQNLGFNSCHKSHPSDIAHEMAVQQLRIQSGANRDN